MHYRRQEKEDDELEEIGREMVLVDIFLKKDSKIRSNVIIIMIK